MTKRREFAPRPLTVTDKYLRLFNERQSLLAARASLATDQAEAEANPADAFAAQDARRAADGVAQLEAAFARLEREYGTFADVEAAHLAARDANA